MSLRSVLGSADISCCFKNAEMSAREAGWDSSVVSQRYLSMMSVRFVSIELSTFILSYQRFCDRCCASVSSFISAPPSLCDSLAVVGTARHKSRNSRRLASTRRKSTRVLVHFLIDGRLLQSVRSFDAYVAVRLLTGKLSPWLLSFLLILPTFHTLTLLRRSRFRYINKMSNSTINLWVVLQILLCFDS